MERSASLFRCSILLLAVSLISACNGLIPLNSPQNQAQAKAVFQLAGVLSGSGSRTIQSAGSSGITAIQLTLRPTAGADLGPFPLTGTNFSVTVTPGSYTAIVEAFATGPILVASWQGAVTLNPGSNAPISVTLQWVGSGTGTVSINLSWPSAAGITAVTVQTATDLAAYGTEVSAGTISGGEPATLSYVDNAVPAGNLRVHFQFKNVGGATILDLSEAVQVLPNLPSYKSISLQVANFSSAPAAVPGALSIVADPSGGAKAGITISWTAAAANTATGYLLQRKVDDGTLNSFSSDTGYSTINAISSGAVGTYTDLQSGSSPLATGTFYDYRIAAVNKYGQSAYNAIGPVDYSLPEPGASGTGVQKKWRFLIGSSITSNPLVASDGTIYLSAKDSLFAIKPDGNLKWRHGFTANASLPSEGHGGRIYLTTDDGNSATNDAYLYALNPVDGSVIWSVPINMTVSGPVVVGSDETLYIPGNSGGGIVRAFHSDGSGEKWSCALANGASGGLALANDGSTYIPGNSGYVSAVDATGVLKWSYNSGANYYGVNANISISKDGTIYFANEELGFYALIDGGSVATLKWNFGIGISNMTPSIAADGTVYIGNNSGTMYGLIDNISNASLVSSWPISGGLAGATAITAADGTLYIVDTTGTIFAKAPMSGNTIWSYTTNQTQALGWSVPALGPDGTVYVGSGDGYLYALKDNANTNGTGPWTMAHANPQRTGRFPQ